MEDALRHAVRAPSVPPGRIALVAGSVGRVGEELLNQVLSSPRYHRVHVLTRRFIEASTDKLGVHAIAGESLPAESAALALPAVEDLYCCLSDERSFYRRDDIYHRVAPEQLLPLARAAFEGGARRCVILAPMEAIEQMSGIADYLAHGREADLAGLGFDSLTIIRPTREREAHEPGGLHRLGALLVSTLASYMTPPRFQPRRAVVLARAATEAMARGGPGVTVIPVHKLHDETAA